MRGGHVANEEKSSQELKEQIVRKLLLMIDAGLDSQVRLDPAKIRDMAQAVKALSD